MMATESTSQPQSVTYVLSLNDSDLLQLYDEIESNRPLYVHNYVDILLVAIVTLVAFACNALLAASILQSSPLFSTLHPFRVTLLSLTALHFVDAVFDGAIAIVYMTRVFWEFGLFLCYANAFVVHLWLLVLPLTLVHSGLICLRSNLRNRHRTNGLCCWIIGGTWTLAAFLIIGLFQIPWLEVRPYPARNVCSLGPARYSAAESAGGGIMSIWLLLAIMCVIPLAILVMVTGSVVHVLWRDRQLKRRIAHLSTADDDTKRRLSRDEIRSLFITWFALLAVYLVGVMPYAVHTHCGHDGMWLEDQSSPLFDQQMPTRWEVCRTPTTDAVVTWIRLFVPWLHPVIVIALNEDLRRETLFTLLWWRRPRTQINDTVIFNDHRKRTLLTDLKFFRRGGSGSDHEGGRGVEVHPSIPVLFPSSQGLCLRRPPAKVDRRGGGIADDDIVHFVCSFSDVIADCCRTLPSRSDIIADKVKIVDVVASSSADDNDHQRATRAAASSHLQQATTVANNSKNDENAYRNRERDLKIGIWPQVARISGPRNDAQLRGSVNRSRRGLGTRPGSHPFG